MAALKEAEDELTKPPPKPESPLSVVNLGSGARILSLRGYHESGDTYDRFQRALIWTDQGTATLYRRTQVPGAPYLPARTYTLRIGARTLGAFNFTAGQNWARISFDISGLAKGWHLLEVDGAADGEVAVPWFACVVGGEPSLMPVAEGSHKTPTDPTRFEWAYVWEHPTYTPTPKPLAPREFPPVTQSTKVRAQCVTRPERSVTISVPAITKQGVVVSHGKQSYFWYDQLARWPMVPLLDGPRGVGTHPLTTHIEAGEGRQVPGGKLRHTFYFSDPWRVSRGKEDGSTQTLVGYRHKGMASYWEDGADQRTLELVGDWSSVPESRRGLWGVRSFCWDQSTLAVDETTTIPAEENRPPHVVAPVLYLTEQREIAKGGGRILRVEFNARAHDIPPKVSELAIGLKGPWGIVDWGDKLIVSLRDSSQLVVVDKGTGFVQPFAAGFGAVMQSNGIPKTAGTLAERRAQPCLAPECLKIQDGKLYVGSYAQEAITRWDLGTLTRDDYLMPVRMARQSWFVEFALSDGGFGPRGTVFAQTWGQSDHAGAYGIQPDTTRFDGYAKAAPWDKGIGYPCAVATFGGRLYTAASNFGITRYGASMPGDMTIDLALYSKGEREWDALHGNLRWGSMGFGNHGRPLPRGQSSAIDHWLDAHDA